MLNTEYQISRTQFIRVRQAPQEGSLIPACPDLKDKFGLQISALTLVSETAPPYYILFCHTRFA